MEVKFRVEGEKISCIDVASEVNGLTNFVGYPVGFCLAKF